jgi:hypothetical protein
MFRFCSLFFTFALICKCNLPSYFAQIASYILSLSAQEHYAVPPPSPSTASAVQTSPRT